MTPEIEALRSNRTVIVSVIVAAVSVTVLCLVGIAVMLGWVGKRPPAMPVGVATAPRSSSAVSPGVSLIPGETLVTPAETSATPAAPRSAPAAPAARSEPAPRPRPAAPAYARPAEPKPNPAPRRAPRTEPGSGSARAEAHPTDPGDAWPRKLVCRTCGTVTAIATFPDLWEVRVRLEDGATLSVRYPSPPTLHIGDRVRLANGRLERE